MGSYIQYQENDKTKQKSAHKRHATKDSNHQDKIAYRINVCSHTGTACWVALFQCNDYVRLQTTHN